MNLSDCFYVIVLYLGNGLPILALSTFFAVLPVLQEDIGLSHTQRAKMISMAPILYCTAKLICGAALDRYGPRIAWSLSLAMGSVFLIGIATAHADFPSVVVACLVFFRFTCGFLWTSLMVSLSSRFRGSSFTTVLGVVSTSSRVGAVLGGYLASFFLARSAAGWRNAVYVSAAACFIHAIVLAMFLVPVTKADVHADTNPAHAGSNSNTDARATTSIGRKPDKTDRQPRTTEVLAVALSSPRMLLVVLFAMLSYPVFTLEKLFPSYFVEQGMPAADAARVSSGVPAGMALVLPLAGLVIGRSPKFAAGLVSVGIGGSGVLMLLLSQLNIGSSSPTEAVHVQRVAQTILFAIGFCYAPAVYFPAAKFGNAYGGDRNKGLIISMIDCAGNLSISLFNLVLPYLVSSVGWAGVMTMMAMMLVASAVVIAYLQWWQLREPVQVLVVGDRAGSSAKEKDE